MPAKGQAKGQMKRDFGGRGAGRRLAALALCAALVTAFATAYAARSFAAPTGDAASDDYGLADDGGELKGAIDLGYGTDGDAVLAEETAEETSKPRDPPFIEITLYPKNMVAGNKTTIGYDVKNAEPGMAVKWTSSNDEIATIDSRGSVHAVAAGKVEITASAGEAKASVLISVEEPVINPESFDVEIAEFTSADMLLDAHELKIGDELHLLVKIKPDDAMLNGVFEWRANVSGVVTIAKEGGINEGAALKAVRSGEVTVTVSYADQNEDESNRVRLEDYRLALLVKEEETSPDPLLIAILSATIAAVVIVAAAIAAGRGRRRIEEERRALAARRRRGGTARERRRRPERKPPPYDGREQGYEDGADRLEKITRVYNAPVAPGRDEPPDPSRPLPQGAPPRDGDGPPEPFSLDDIK
jgi:hypothetical protein